MHALLQRSEGFAELLVAAARQFLLLLEEQAVGESVLAGRVRCCRHLDQVGAADDAVLVIAEQGLDRLGRLGNLGPVDCGGDVA